MKIAHVVTFVSVDGAFGGPVAVAMAQAEALVGLGHSVDVLAGWDGIARLEVPGIKIRLFQARKLTKRSFSGLYSSGLRSFLRRRASEYDVIHIHLGRDLVTLPAALAVLRRDVPLVIQSHGMIVPDARRSIAAIDWLMTRRVLKQAKVVFSLTHAETSALLNLGVKASKIEQISNGVSVPKYPVVPWPIRRVNPEVIFLARLHPRKHVLAFAHAAKLLIDRGYRVKFRILGPDEGDLKQLLDFVGEHSLDKEISYEGSVPAGSGPAVLARATAYVLPSHGEVFPMTVLEAMSVGTPPILSDDCGIAASLDQAGAALITDGSPVSVADAIARLLDDASFAETMHRSALNEVRESYGVTAVARVLERAYAQQVLAEHR